MNYGSIPPTPYAPPQYDGGWAQRSSAAINALAAYINNPKVAHLPGGAINITAWPYNARADDSLYDNSPGIQRALDDAGGAPLVGPIGKYRLNSKITSATPVQIMGFGSGAGPGFSTDDNCTQFVQFFGGDNLFEVTTPYSCIFQDFQVKLDSSVGVPAAGAAIKLKPPNGLTTANSIFRNVAALGTWRGIDILRPSYPLIERCYFQDWIDAAVNEETSAGIEGSGGFIRSNFFFSSTTQPAVIRLKCGYVIVSQNEILGGNVGVLIQVTDMDAGFIRIYQNTIENQYRTGVAAYSVGNKKATMMAIEQNEFSVVDPTFAANYQASTYIDENLVAGVGTNWIDDVSVSLNTTRHVTVNALMKHHFIGAGRNVRVAGNILEELGAASPNGIQITGLTTNTALVGPISVEDSTFLGTFGAEYAITAVTRLRDMQGLTFAQIPAAAANGSTVYVSDGTAGAPLTGAGTGSLAVRLNGAWKGL